MQNNNNLIPENIFEVSWEVANKVGGIHTVLSTKASSLQNIVGENLIFIGPDVWREVDSSNPEFTEDPGLYKYWQEQAEKENLRIKVGRWNIYGNPIAILVDFTTLFAKKDEIFKLLWEKYKLDSISGGWDYVEPVLFGYAAGQVIESFCKHNSIQRNKIIAQFHEWMTGAGILYLKDKAPHISTVFTTHATVLGRTVAGNGKELYKNMKQWQPELVAKDFNVISKQSLEKLSAQNADAFTTVSDITSKECTQFLQRKVDIVTVNGFEDDIVPKKEDFTNKLKIARNKLKQVSEALLGYKISENTLFVAISGRYEYRNKGIDVFLDALGNINKSNGTEKDIIAFFLVPTNNIGAVKELSEKMNGNNEVSIQNKFLTHKLQHHEQDPILNKLHEIKITNKQKQKVKVIFAPAYLDETDGIFNLTYYNTLIGFDLTVFPSYYEPWGYTPLESIAFKVPTITTDLAGFGMWVKNEFPNETNAVHVIESSQKNYTEIVQALENQIIKISNFLPEELQKYKEKASVISKQARWKNFANNYIEAYKIAIEKCKERKSEIIEIEQPKYAYSSSAYSKYEKPTWKQIEIQSFIPEEFKDLKHIATNLWWTWNTDARELFKSINKDLWGELLQNPVAYLNNISNKRFEELKNDKEFVQNYKAIVKKFNSYLSESSVSTSNNSTKDMSIAYFSMEFGFHDSLKIFSGGLGILAGDYLKGASDANINMIGVGLLYRKGYFKQILSPTGEQLAIDAIQDFSQMPITKVIDKNGNWQFITIKFPGRTLYAKIWKVEVGRTILYLLDTDNDKNSEQDRTITHQLYGGNNENRFKQEMLLGIGGIRALQKLGIEPALYHCNEGHAAFIGLERLNNLITKEVLSFPVSHEIVRASTLFTTHTPVKAGHDTFSEDILRTYMPHYPQKLKISWDEFMNLGKIEPTDKIFSMSILAAKMSQEINGVSMLHGDVSKELFKNFWKGYLQEEQKIGYVTNGVHYKSWTAKQWQKLYSENFGEDFENDLSNNKHWNKIHNVSDNKIWEIRTELRKKLIDFIRKRIRKSWIKSYQDPKHIVETLDKLDENILTIGFARRFATYKRANLLFANLKRISKILNNKDMPVQIVFAGKAHPNDGEGQDLIKEIVDYSKQDEFIGKIIFLEDYNIALARKLVQGVDIWLNTPTRPQEASGTSGMKAIMNGVLHFSVLDGWWVEGYQKEAGWALEQEKIYDKQEFQNKLDAETMYSMLENEIIPLFYDRNKENIPEKWLNYIKNSIADIVPQFTTKRMLDDYINKFYNKLYKRKIDLTNNQFAKAKELVQWKNKVKIAWGNIKIISVNYPQQINESLNLNEEFKSEIIIDLKELAPQDIGIELVIVDNTNPDNIILINKFDYNFTKAENNYSYYELTEKPEKSGVFAYSIRIYAKNKLLPYQQDCKLVKWI